MAQKRTARRASSGRLRIGDDWNAITIIALSQSNPLKAVAELVENSIDANARTSRSPAVERRVRPTFGSRTMVMASRWMTRAYRIFAM